ncbi:MAG: hypothetical protein A3F84_28055 [Candidatus Handelsmanbacteria bacterium RIFCSPLOWO2_12_FULL_64_10]|uniref:SWIM-type domain-containing protein n=1 Tax=Handelsmanbacteria sp. (strain RIFCSPLOWO2_12_FULL_64_10) TaxID=1817868 RepID=A0A1F6C4F8_HANXR|nr:MAG: hypothetical protein A3F84_28055 [Candidatus Handelsmanbacteria bacterium RIFCSPLOWO2_12_FULL_64_10]
MSRWGYYEYFKPSRPRAVKGGIKAQSGRGAFGESWWAKRWIGVLESFHIGARLGRGRSYARGGQVLSIAVDKGRVKAKVQGSRPRPYDVVIEVKPIPDAGWGKLIKALSGQAVFAAKLLAGEMPQDIEQAFGKAGLSLFPERLRDLKTDCSCPDWSNPCKHIAAVYYLLGEEFDRDPFLIFKLRGLSREGLVERLGASGKKEAPRKGRGRSSPAAEKGMPPPKEPLVPDVPVFWEGAGLPDGLLGEVRVPPAPASLVKRLGNFPFWRGEERFMEAVEAVYLHASPRGLNVFLGDELPDERERA